MSVSIELVDDLVAEIVRHHRENPTHGIDCACMDAYIREVRKATNVDHPIMQSRVDYVLRKATENRLARLVERLKEVGAV